MAARTKLDIKTVRVPTKLVRATLIKAKFDDLDNYLDTRLIEVKAAAGAISPNSDVVYIDATAPAMALTLADGTVNGQTLTAILRSKTATGTAVLTPANLAAGTSHTFDTVGERAQLIWVSPDWVTRAGFTSALT